MDASPRFLRRPDAAAYLSKTYGFCTRRSLAAYATLGGGPKFHKVGNQTLYSLEALDEWALAKLGEPIASTSEAPNHKPRPAVTEALRRRRGRPRASVCRMEA